MPRSRVQPQNEIVDPFAVPTPVPQPELVGEPGPDVPVPTDPTPADPVPTRDPLSTADEHGRPIPDGQLTPEQRAMRAQQDQLAREAGRADPEPEFEAPAADGDEVIVIHVVADGFTALGKTWYTGQELEFKPGTAAYRDTLDRFGKSWLDLRLDERAQMRAYGGEVKFRSGPWPGLSYSEIPTHSFQRLAKAHGEGPVTPPSIEQLTQAERSEQARRRAAPRMATR